MTPEFSGKDAFKEEVKPNTPYKYVIHQDRGAFEEYIKSARDPISHFQIVDIYGLGTIVDKYDHTFYADGAGWFKFDGKVVMFNLGSNGNSNTNLDPQDIAKRLKELTGLRNVVYTMNNLLKEN